VAALSGWHGAIKHRPPDGRAVYPSREQRMGFATQGEALLGAKILFRGLAIVRTARTGEAENERNSRDRYMQTNVGFIVLNHSEQGTVAVNETNHRDKSVNDAENLKIFPRCSGESAQQSGGAGGEMDAIMHRADHENPEQHSLGRNGWEKSTDTGDEKE
jgi:hypothetical protein